MHSKLTKQESGCLSFSITQDSQNPLQFHVAETFSNQAAFDFHQQRSSHSNWAVVSKHVSRHYQIS
ncbi:putative quinol monooxygenase [Shewanella donghaensis]|uniref:putative quinol monooxygenase n=1 Tax=Shewanella donghaensis TaxID=238836 RepID=UPI003865FF83